MRPIPGHPGYLADVDGSIWSTKVGTVPRRMRTFIRSQRSGYVAVNLTQDGRFRMFTVHSLVALTFLGARPVGAVVMHLNDDRADNRLCNLAYGTPATNSAQMVARSRQATGIRNGAARLTRDAVLAIRGRTLTGESVASIAREFGVAWDTINKAARGLTWRTVRS